MSSRTVKLFNSCQSIEIWHHFGCGNSQDRFEVCITQLRPVARFDEIHQAESLFTDICGAMCHLSYFWKSGVT